MGGLILSILKLIQSRYFFWSENRSPTWMGGTSSLASPQQVKSATSNSAVAQRGAIQPSRQRFRVDQRISHKVCSAFTRGAWLLSWKPTRSELKISEFAWDAHLPALVENRYIFRSPFTVISPLKNCDLFGRPNYPTRAGGGILFVRRYFICGELNLDGLQERLGPDWVVTQRGCWGGWGGVSWGLGKTTGWLPTGCEGGPAAPG